MDELIHKIIYEFSYPLIFWKSIVYLSILYFGVGSLFLKVCIFLNKKGILHKIVDEEPPDFQVKQEIKNSILSILLFGLSGVAMLYLVRSGIITLLPNTFLNTMGGLILLTIWNEIHFFLVHRLMHLPYFMKRVHYIHHRSYIPTVYSVYSFHWFEALLLGTVSLVIAPFIDFSIFALFLYPLVSILFNFSGHCNYRFGSGKGKTWSLFATNHNRHHHKARKNYGFATHILDRFFVGKTNNE